MESQRHQAADPVREGARKNLLWRTSPVQLLERLLDRRATGIPARARTWFRAAGDFSQRARHILDALSDRPDVGPDRHERSGRRTDHRRQAQPGDRFGYRSVRCK